MEAAYDVINSIFTNTKNFCWLCCNQVEDDPIRLEDDVILPEVQSTDQTTALRDVMAYVLGHKITELLSPSEAVCKQCTHSCIQSYVFIRRSKKNYETMSLALQMLKNKIDCSRIDSVYYRTVNFKINIERGTADFCYYRKKITEKEMLLEELNSEHAEDSTYFAGEIEDFGAWEEQDSPNQNIIQHRSCTDSLKKKELFTIIEVNKIIWYECNNCYNVFNDYQTAKVHYDNAHRPNVTDYKNKYNEVSHSKQRYTCLLCDKFFTCDASIKTHCYKYHMRPTNKNEIITNHESQQIYSTFDDSNHHVKQNKLFTCNECNKSFPTKPLLRVHIKNRHIDVCFICPRCSRRCDSRKHLQQHLIVHTRERNFPCDRCNGKFVSKQSLQHHKLLHIGEKPFKCHQCHEAFVSNYRLKGHILGCHGERKYECDICGKKYKNAKAVKRHSKIHLFSGHLIHSSIAEHDYTTHDKAKKKTASSKKKPCIQPGPVVTTPKHKFPPDARPIYHIMF